MRALAGYPHARWHVGAPTEEHVAIWCRAHERRQVTHRKPTKIHEYCELFMIIRCLSIQSHDNLGVAVFKLMIISVCCIQTQLIVFMPHAGDVCDAPTYGYVRVLVARLQRTTQHTHCTRTDKHGGPSYIHLTHYIDLIVTASFHRRVRVRTHSVPPHKTCLDLLSRLEGRRA